MRGYQYFNNREIRHYCCKSLFIACICLLGGCFQQEKPPELNLDSDTKANPVRQQYIAGHSVRGRPIVYQVFGAGDDVVFILGAIHGDEPASAILVNYLADFLHQNLEYLAYRKVVVLPVANPDGYTMRKRTNARGVDINRNFDSANRINQAEYGQTALSEPEAMVIENIIQQYRPNRIVSVHQPFACVDYDGPGQLLAERMAQLCDLPVRKLGTQPGSLGSYAGETLDITIITLEMRKHDSWLTGKKLWQHYGSALLAAIDG